MIFHPRFKVKSKFKLYYKIENTQTGNASSSALGGWAGAFKLYKVKNIIE